MADLHIEDFYNDAARVFTLLYGQFPRKTILYVDDICGPDEPDEFGLHTPRFEAAYSAAVWLAEQGYLRFDQTVRQEALDQAVLTERSFLLLSSRYSALPPDGEPPADLPPSVAAHAISRIEQLRGAIKSGVSAAVSEAVRELLEQAKP